GLGMPNVNPFVINRADKLGLGQLYRLRGRVGGGAHRAYAYLFYARKARLRKPRASDYRRSSRRLNWVQDSRSRSGIWRSAAPVTCSVLNRAGSWQPWGSTCT